MHVLHQALANREGPFLDVDASSALSYAEVRSTAARIGSFLRKHSVTRGDTVAVAMSNNARSAAVWFGLLREGVSIVPLNPGLLDEEIVYILRMAEAKMLLVDRTTLPRAAPWCDENGRLQAVLCDDEPWKGYSEADEPYVDPEDIAVIFFTSGTTGRPKGAMLSHRALMENARGCAVSYGLDASSAFACPIPIFHSLAATVCLFLPALVGGRTYLHSPLDLPGFVATVPGLASPRILVAVPSVLEGLHHVSGGRLGNIAFTVSGGAALAADLRDRIHAATGSPVYEGYGTTECGPVISSQAPGGRNAPGGVGPAIDGVEVEIRTSEGNVLRAGEIGEIVTRTPGLMSGYYDLASATRATIKGGWFHTGDLGYLSPEGELFIVDRLTDAITVKGITVLPQNIESALLKYPSVQEAAVVGIPDGAGGEAPWAFVRCRPGQAANPADLIRFCRDRLPIYAVPRGVELRDSLPKTITGKILKRTLRQKWL